jgi:uncharacterized protein (DUF1697 family)
MSRFVALFRGINVGKAKRIAMADLRTLLQTLGYTEVRTLLNSGNAVFDAARGSAQQHAKYIQAAVAKTLGVDALVIVKSAKEINAIVAGNTLGDLATDPSRLIVAMTQDAPSLARLKTIADTDWAAEEVHLGEHAAYLWCANGILESKVAGPLLKDLAHTGTTRNWATLEKIQALMAL